MKELKGRLNTALPENEKGVRIYRTVFGLHSFHVCSYLKIPGLHHVSWQRSSTNTAEKMTIRFIFIHFANKRGR